LSKRNPQRISPMKHQSENLVMEKLNFYDRKNLLSWGLAKGMQRVFAPRSTQATSLPSKLPTPDVPIASEVSHFSCKLDWKEVEVEKKVKYIIEEDKGDDTIVQIYSGFGTDARVEDLESLKKYRYRVKIEDTETFHTAVSEWIEVMTEKEPAGIKNLNKAIKRDDAVKVRTFMMTEKNLDLNIIDEIGFSPLMTAAAYNAIECLDCLLEFDPDLDLQNPTGKTALMLACQSGHVEAAVRLLDEGAGLEAGEGTSSPLHWAVDSNSTEIVKRLLEYDCDVNHIDESTNWTPLFRLASVTGNSEVAQVFIDNGGDVSICDKDGTSPLMQAVINNHHHLVKVLLDNGADADELNSMGRSARDMATAFGKPLVLQHFQ